MYSILKACYDYHPYIIDQSISDAYLLIKKELKLTKKIEHTEEYDILYILKPKLTEAEYTELNNIFKKWITDTDGTITSENIIGSQSVGPTFKTYTEGYYVNYQYTGNTTINETIKSNIKVNENFLRFMIVKKSSIKTAAPVKETA